MNNVSSGSNSTVVLFVDAGVKVAQFPDSDQSAVECSCPYQELLAAGDSLSAHAASSYVDSDDIMSFPPPPDQLLNQQDITVADSDDEFPLPPPPDEEMIIPQISQAPRPIEPANRYPGLMHSLSVRLAERGSVQVRPGPPVAAKQYRMTVAEQLQSVSHAAASAVNKSSSVETDFLSQIHRGISLRRTVSNDRSAPRISGRR